MNSNIIKQYKFESLFRLNNLTVANVVAHLKQTGAFISGKIKCRID